MTMLRSWTTDKLIFASFALLALLIGAIGATALGALGGTGDESAKELIAALLCAGVAFACIAAWALSQSIRRRVGAAICRAESSSERLQTAANEQATGAQQLAASTSEITTTIKELLATSRQIAESAQR